MRHIQAPDVEINEFDRSLYGNLTDYSLPNSPICFLAGFADKGEDYNINWINTRVKFEDKYGYPTNEAERYLYNGAAEIIDSGGVCLVAKLPYFNKAKDRYTYASYTLRKKSKRFIPLTEILEDTIVSKLISKSLYKFLFFPDIDVNSVNYLISEHMLYVKNNNDLIVGAFVIERFDEDTLAFFNPTVSDHENAVSLDADESELAITPDGDYTDRKISDLLSQNGIYLRTISDLLEYVDDLCDFDYGSYRIFKHLFYDSTGHCKNDAMYLLSAIFEQPTYDNLSAFNTECSSYMEQISSMHDTLVNVEGLNDFESYYISFVKSKTIDYFKDVYDEIINIILTSETVRSESDRSILLQIMQSFDNLSAFSIDYTDVLRLDNSISTYYEIESNPLSDCIHMSFDKFDDFKTGVNKPEESLFYIVDITRSKYGKMNILSGELINVKQKVFKDKEFLGIVPIVTTPVNAMYFQELIENDSDVRISAYNPVADLQTIYVDDAKQTVIGRDLSIQDFNYSVKLSSLAPNEGTVSEIASKLFPALKIHTDGYLSRDLMKHIGVVVFKAYKDTANNDKIGFTLLESFSGSLDRNAEDPVTHANLYIGNVINDSSQYINFFSNVNINDLSPEFDTYVIKNLTATSLGFYEFECIKDISWQESINKPLNVILEHANNPYSIPLDLVIDAGVSNIALFIRTIYWKDGYGKYDFNIPDNIAAIKNITASNVNAWNIVLLKYDNFCKNVRKDCMFLADSLRNFALVGNQKKVRRTAVHNTIVKDILPSLKYMTALDSSYSAGYCTWLHVVDRYSGNSYWQPPSIKAASVYIYTDVFYKHWDAPAGLNRGVLRNVYDIAFNPNLFEAGKLYNLQWNYVVSYPIDGIVLEGQKTFLKNKTALDRVNVRRLMLYLEKAVVRIGRYYLYEGNTEYLRLNFVDAITTIFDDAVDGNGIKEYAIKCDEDNNTIETIENHELHVKIAVKPIKTLEFLVVDFIVTNLSANVNEEVLK